MPWFYISFARDKAHGGFLGGCQVEARNAKDALNVASMRGINPGGGAAISEPLDYPCPDFPRFKLLSKEQMGGGATIGEMEDAGLKISDGVAFFETRVCEACNAGLKCARHN